MRYVTIRELSDMIRRNMWKVPHDIDLVVGIPRSGLLAADIIALYLNVQLCDVDSFVEGRLFSNGLSRGDFVRKPSIIQKVLVVDDSICNGNAMKEAKKKLDVIHDKSYEFIFCTPIATSYGSTVVDLFFEIIDEVRVFEWNLFHHWILQNACVDIDGVLCLDPVEDDDGEVYRRFLQTATPLFVPTVQINTLISCRLEKYRKLTEEWLDKHNVKYNQLIMLDMPDKASRVAWGKHGDYKGEYYMSRYDCMLFIESSYNQAKRIAELSGKPVFCVETNELLQIVKVSRKKRILRVIKKRFPYIYRFARYAYTGFIK